MLSFVSPTYSNAKELKFHPFKNGQMFRVGYTLQAKNKEQAKHMAEGSLKRLIGKGIIKNTKT